MAEKKTTTKKSTNTKKVEKKQVKVEDVEPVAPTIKKERGKKLSIRKLLILLTALLLIVLGIIFVIKLFTKKPSYKDKASYSESFFIKNNKGKYALFSDKGKQYTKFIYENTGKFILNHTVVQNDNNEYAIIDSKGKETVKFGKYNYITDYNGLYKVRSDKGYALINHKGKVLLDSEKLDVTSYGTDYPVIIASTSDKFYIYMYDGTKITTLDKKSGVKDPTVNYIEYYATVYYNKENIVIDLSNKKEKLRFNSDVHYCVNASTENNKVLSYNACVSWFEILAETGHKLSNGKKVIDLSDKCDQLYVYENTIICSKEYNKYFVSVKGSKAELSKKLPSTIAFYDDENYVYRDDKSYDIVFVKNGKKVKSIEGALSSIGKVNEKAYVLYIDGSYEFYDLSGKKMYDKSFKYAYPFDENGLAKVSINGNDKYLINFKGKNISSKYSDIKNEGKFYIVSDKDNKKGIINEDGKEIVKTKYDNILVKEFREKYYAVLTNGEKYTIYNLSKNKEILTTKDFVQLNEHYIKTSGKETKYYTYNNKLIYTE